MSPHPPRRAGLRLVIGYKLVKAPVMLAAALALALGKGHAVQLAALLTRELTDRGELLERLARWLAPQLTQNTMAKAAWIGLADGLSTGLEAWLLILGKPWGEWMVIGALALFLPFEVGALLHRPSAARLALLGINLAVVVVLGRLRWAEHRRRHPRAQH